jgi:hypothetical protein
MPMNPEHPSYAGRASQLAAAVRESQAADVQSSQRPDPVPGIDWQIVRRAGRSCCCSAGPVVIAIMPASPGRQHPTELLLCMHHYRVSHEALAASSAAVVDLSGDLIDLAEQPFVVDSSR